MPSLREELESIVVEGLAERESFASDWRKAQVVISEQLEVAAEVLLASLGSGASEILDGAVTLVAECFDYRYSLKYTSDPQRLLVVCQSSVEGEPERRYSLAGLKRGAIVDDIKSFTRSTSRGVPAGRLPLLGNYRKP
jgi:hypothetical protein